MKKRLVRAVKSLSAPDGIEWEWINKLDPSEKSTTFPHHKDAKDDLLSKGVHDSEIEFEFPLEIHYSFKGDKKKLHYLRSFSDRDDIAREIADVEGITVTDNNSPSKIDVKLTRYYQTEELDNFAFDYK